MKSILITTIAAVVLVGCGESQQSASSPESKPAEPVAEAAKPTTPPKAVSANKGADPARGINPEPPTAKAPAIYFHGAAINGDIEAVKQHLAAGTDVNAKGPGGETPLHDAAIAGRKEIVELLIAKGANVNAKDRGGQTPFDLAGEVYDWHSPEVKANHFETVDLLRKHGGKTGAELKAEGK